MTFITKHLFSRNIHLLIKTTNEKLISYLQNWIIAIKYYEFKIFNTDSLANDPKKKLIGMRRKNDENKNSYL